MRDFLLSHQYAKPTRRVRVAFHGPQRVTWPQYISQILLLWRATHAPVGHVGSAWEYVGVSRSLL